MHWLKKIFDFLLFSNCYVAYCVVVLCMSTEFLLGYYSYQLNLFVFFATLFTYNFQRLLRMEVKAELSHRQQWLQANQKGLWFVTMVSAVATVYFSLSLSIDSLVLLIPLGAIALMYPLPMIPFKGKMLRLREVPGIKIFLIALVWALVTVGLLVEQQQLSWTVDVWLLFLQRFFFVFAITIPFDIRDLKYDSTQLKTIPSILGEEKARYVAYGALAVYELLLISQFVFGEVLVWQTLIALLSVSAVTAFLLYKSTADRGEYYFAFWVEGASILMYLFLQIALFG
jgi:hypothetical protein